MCCVNYVIEKNPQHIFTKKEISVENTIVTVDENDMMIYG